MVEAERGWERFGPTLCVFSSRTKCVYYCVSAALRPHVEVEERPHERAAFQTSVACACHKSTRGMCWKFGAGGGGMFGRVSCFALVLTAIPAHDAGGFVWG